VNAVMIRPCSSAGFLAFEELRWLAWDAASPSRTCTVMALSEHNAGRAAAIELRIPQWRARVRRALPEVTEGLASLGVA
jgi:hypothetical protein